MEVIAESENIFKEVNNYIEYWFYDIEKEPIYKSKRVYKNQSKIILYPHSLGEDNIARPKKVSEIELLGWSSMEEVPSLLRTGKSLSLNAGKIKHIIKHIYDKYPNIEKVIIQKNGRTTFGTKTVKFAWSDLETLLKEVGSEIRRHERRRKITALKGLSKLNSTFSYKKMPLMPGIMTKILELYDFNPKFSEADIDSMMNYITLDTKSKVTITDNFIKTKDKINVAYLDDIIQEFKKLMKSKTNNEKKWQEFFESHGWILNNLFPYQVILSKREAFVGGKTIEDANGRYVDFLFQNGYKDNYALIEIKTHLKPLLKKNPYRKPDAFAMDEELSGSLSQCLDQKNTFISEFGDRLKILDPKVILIIGQKSLLNENQSACFELIRNNQNSIDIVTFDELLEKMISLRNILNQ